MTISDVLAQGPAATPDDMVQALADFARLPEAAAKMELAAARRAARFVPGVTSLAWWRWVQATLHLMQAVLALPAEARPALVASIGRLRT